MPVCLLPSHQCMQNEPSDTCDKAVPLLLGSLPFVSLLQKFKTRRKVKAEGANLSGTQGEQIINFALCMKNYTKCMCLGNCDWQPLVKGCVWKFVLYGDLCISVASYLNRYQFTGQDQGSLCSSVCICFLLGWTVCLVLFRTWKNTLSIEFNSTHPKKQTQDGNQIGNIQKMLASFI